MTQLIKLWDEKDLIRKLQRDTLILIRASEDIEPVKKLVEASEILDLTNKICELFPTEFPDPPIGDEAALMRLHQIAIELCIFHKFQVPIQHVDIYGDKVKTLLRIYRLPK